MKKCTTCARCGPLHGSHGHTCPLRSKAGLTISPVSVPLEDCWRPRKLPFTDPLKRKAGMGVELL